jgi:AcrR family transcriptional regulator
MSMESICAPGPTRREGDRELPLGPKAQRTRAAILEAAAAEFAANGYQRTTVGDVATAAGVSLGTVYQYFRDRTDLVAALVQRVVSEMLAKTEASWRPAEGIEGVYRLILNFVSAYADAAPMAGVWEEVAHLEPNLAALRRSLGRAFTESVEREYRGAAEMSLVDPDLDPALVARALTGMVDRYCYVTYVFDPPEAGLPTPEESALLLARLWSAAIRLVPAP